MTYAVASTSKPCPVCGQTFRVEGFALRATETLTRVDLRAHVRTHPLPTRIRVAWRRYVRDHRIALGIPEEDA